MNHDAASVDRLLHQLAQLRAELALARAVCEELLQALHDERARARPPAVIGSSGA